ncbi:MAG: dTMP kinase [Gammaproteobacteria bacterium TMED30]|nr:dTMP kinase [Gammaproteobacteria bacterium]OUU04836.1 MAG: dTMP kinase [Gammaproteobacteria bacterium TMED30]|tara:strand:+ start:515 stop:1150 length:636 start_codon:yes stop_codon:yes gene_type:complete
MTGDYGKFITLEGSEGVGKTTNIDVVCRLLEANGVPFIKTREPGGTPLAEALREAMLAVREEEVSAMTELLIVFAARTQHLDRVIRPALAAGRWVVCDRFTDASYAYQGYGRGLDLERITALEGWVQNGLQPDLTLLLDLAPEVAEQRMQERTKDRMESEKVEFYQRVRSGYLRRAAQDARFRVIEAKNTIDAVATEIDAHVSALIRDWKG